MENLHFANWMKITLNLNMQEKKGLLFKNLQHKQFIFEKIG